MDKKRKKRGNAADKNTNYIYLILLIKDLFFQKLIKLNIYKFFYNNILFTVII